MTIFDIKITKVDYDREQTDVANYREVPAELAEGINLLLNKFWEAGKLAASFEIIEDEEENPHLEEDQGGRFSDRF